MSDASKRAAWREWLHEVIFEADTPLGKIFDLTLLVAIIGSVTAVMLESVASIAAQYGDTLVTVEWVLTIAFSIEYLLRLVCVDRPSRYAKSFYGVVDVMAILPTYVSLLFPGAQSLLVIRLLRVLRVFRVLKLAQFLSELSLLIHAMRASARKLIVFLGIIMVLMIVLGSLIYIIEGAENGFTSIPRSVYWAIVTMTTVGYGDVTPQTGLGQFIAAIAMISGYAVIAVPTGLVTVALSHSGRQVSTKACTACSAEGHDPNAIYCNQCGTTL